MSYKRFFAGIALLAFFVPCVSFAQTPQATTYSPQYVALLEQLLKLLEQELASIQSSALPITTTSASAPAPSVPSVSVTVSPASIAYDATSTLSWVATNAASCTVNSSPVLLASSGSQVVNPTTLYSEWTTQSSTTYTVTCSGTGGSSSGSATVTVQPWIPPAGIKVLQECTFATAPCTTGPHGWFCSDQHSCGG